MLQGDVYPNGYPIFPWMSARLLVLATSHPATSAPFQVEYSPIRWVMVSLRLSAVGIRFLAVLGIVNLTVTPVKRSGRVGR
jgi:hypothetical protein